RQQAIESELHFEYLARPNVPQIHAFHAGIGPEHIDPQAIADQDSDHRIIEILPGAGSHANREWLARSDALTRMHLDRKDAAGSVAMPVAAADALATRTRRILPLQHHPNVAIYHFAGGAVRGDAAVHHQRSAIGETFDQAQIVRD